MHGCTASLHEVQQSTTPDNAVRVSMIFRLKSLISGMVMLSAFAMMGIMVTCSTQHELKHAFIRSRCQISSCLSMAEHITYYGVPCHSVTDIQIFI